MKILQFENFFFYFANDCKFVAMLLFYKLHSYDFS